MLPDRKEAERLLEEGLRMNPGPWGGHCRVAAACAEKIAVRCSGMDPEKAYILGLLHDIGRRYGVTQLAHVIDGYRFLTSLGYDEAARIAVTHSFAVKDVATAILRTDVDETAFREIERLIAGYAYDDYDRLIQLCDSIALPDGPTDLKTRMDDVERRYGSYPAVKRQAHYRIKEYFERKMGEDLYRVVGVKAPAAEK